MTFADGLHAFLWRPSLLLIGFAVVFITIERLWPAEPDQKPWRRGSGLDLFFSYVNPIVIHPLNGLLIAWLVTAAIGLIGSRTHGALQAWVASHPFWLQFGAALLVADLASYWKHRIFHMRGLWPVHAVHHSATQIDWLTNERDHPLQLLGTYLFVVPPLVLCGFGLELIAQVALLRRAYSLFTHANVRWSFGPLAPVFVSPTFHRWHHASAAQMQGRNFAVFFSFFDVLFRTYASPPGRPRVFGLG